MTLEDVGGDSAAHRAADIVSDLTAWQRGDAPWSELSHSLLISVEPGTGESLLARALQPRRRFPSSRAPSAAGRAQTIWTTCCARCAAIPARPSGKGLPCCSSTRSMRSARGTARTGTAGTIAGMSSSVPQRDRPAEPREGVILIGATNHLDNLDSAILRPGRFDRHCTLGRPFQAQIRRILIRAFPGENDADLTALARAFSGETPAAIDAAIRAAKAAARRVSARAVLHTQPASQVELQV